MNVIDFQKAKETAHKVKAAKIEKDEKIKKQAEIIKTATLIILKEMKLQ